MGCVLCSLAAKDYRQCRMLLARIISPLDEPLQCVVPRNSIALPSQLLTDSNLIGIVSIILRPLQCIIPFLCVWVSKNKMGNENEERRRERSGMVTSDFCVGVNADISTKCIKCDGAFGPHPSSVKPSDLYQVSHISSPFHSIHLIHFIQLFSIFAALVMLSANQGHLICLVPPVFMAALTLRRRTPNAFMLKNQLENEDWRFSVSWSICNFVFRLLSSVKCMFLTVSSFNFFLSSLHSLAYSVVCSCISPLVSSLAYSLSFSPHPSVYRIFRNVIVVMWATFKNCTNSMVSKTHENEVDVSTILW